MLLELFASFSYLAWAFLASLPSAEKTAGARFTRNRKPKIFESSIYVQTVWNIKSLGLPPSNFIAGRPKAALLFWFLGGFRCGEWLCFVVLVRYKNSK